MAKKYGLIGLLVVVGLAALAFPLWVAAQGTNPPATPTPTAAQPGCPGWGGRGGGMGHGPMGGSLVAVTAEVTGLSVTEVITELQEGQTFVQIAAAHDVSEEALVDAVMETREEQLAQAVAAGKLTQEQVDERLALMREHVTEQVNAAWTPGQGRMHGGMGGGMRGGGMRGGRMGPRSQSTQP